MSEVQNGQPAGFRLLPVAGVVVSLLVGLQVWAQWYGGAVALPRYCDNPTQALVQLRQVLTEKRPAGDQPRTPYLLAAKLIFLVPQREGEPLDDYLLRVESQIRAQCR